MSTKIITPIGAEIALPTSVETSSTIGGRTRVRIINTAGAHHVVTIVSADDTLKGSFSMANHEVTIIHKAHTDKVYSDSASIKAVAVEIRD